MLAAGAVIESRSEASPEDSQPSFYSCLGAVAVVSRRGSGMPHLRPGQIFKTRGVKVIVVRNGSEGVKAGKVRRNKPYEYKKYDEMILAEVILVEVDCSLGLEVA